MADRQKGVVPVKIRIRDPDPELAAIGEFEDEMEFGDSDEEAPGASSAAWC